MGETSFSLSRLLAIGILEILMKFEERLVGGSGCKTGRRRGGPRVVDIVTILYNVFNSTSYLICLQFHILRKVCLAGVSAVRKNKSLYAEFIAPLGQSVIAGRICAILQLT